MKFELNIEDHTYSIPDFYTLGQWAKMNQWNMKDPNDWPFLVADALDIKNPGVIMKMKYEDETKFTFLVSIVLSALNLKGDEVAPEIHGHRMLNMNELNLGAFIDLDILASEGKNLDKLFATLYDIPLETARELPVHLALPALKQFSDWRRSIYRSYSALFDYRDINPEDSVKPDASEETKMSPAHSWYEVVMALTDGTFRDIDYVVNRPFREAFNFLAWKKTKMAEERMAMEKAKQKLRK